jgi:hypothetical protein
VSVVYFFTAKGEIKMKNMQIVPIEKVGIPIDIITKTAMNISLDAGKEITKSQTISIIPEDITTDQILKMAAKKTTTFSDYELKKLKELKITPQDDNISYSDIFNMATSAHFIITQSRFYAEDELVIMLPDIYGNFSNPRAINSMNCDEVVDNILKRGIFEGVQDFEELPVKTLDNISDQEIIDLADRAGLFNQTIAIGTGEFKESTKSVALYDSRKRNLTNQVTFAVKSPNATNLTEFDYAVLDACITEKKNGNAYTTVNRIFHILGGGHILTPQMRVSILESLECLAGVRLHICIDKDAMKKGIIPKDQQGRFRESKTSDSFVFCGYLLPTESATVTINGGMCIHINSDRIWSEESCKFILKYRKRIEMFFRKLLSSLMQGVFWLNLFANFLPDF